MIQRYWRLCQRYRWLMDFASAEELLARKRADALVHGHSDLDPQLIVDIIRADRESH